MILPHDFCISIFDTSNKILSWGLLMKYSIGVPQERTRLIACIKKGQVKGKGAQQNTTRKTRGK